MGIADVWPNEIIEREKKKIKDIKFASVEKNIKAYADGTLVNKVGLTAAQTLEFLIVGDLNAIRSEAGNNINRVLPLSNNVQVMSTCKSKGSNLNLCQMMALLGQQTVSGSRIEDGFVYRSLPHFQYHSKDAASRGFIPNCFYSGLEPTEFFFHMMGGREGLVDTAVKTAETGYMQRRLVKALEDLSVKYDLSVRTSGGRLVQFLYGEDGLNPAMMEGKNRPLNFVHELEQVLLVTRGPNYSRKLDMVKALAISNHQMAKAINMFFQFKMPLRDEEGHFVPHEER